MAGETAEQEWRVLCADDDEGICRLYRAIFGRGGWDVTVCCSGEEAVAQLQKDAFDLVVLDVIMPGLGGMDLCNLLKEEAGGPDGPVVFLVSGVGSEESIDAGFEAGAADYLVKPFQPTELLAKAKRSLKARANRAVTKKGEVGVGSTYADRYEIQGVIASGGYSVVFEARDQIGNHQIALKLYDLPLAMRRSQAVSGFLREAYQLSRLEHPNIVQLLDFGQAEGFFYLAMERVGGRTLKQLVVESGPIEVPVLALACQEIVSALAYLSEQGLVHRDIKPSNLIVNQSGTTKVIDFGLARAIKEGTLSLEDEFQGTPSFVSPEMIKGVRDLDERSDLYSLGATLYYAATGELPFKGEGNYEILESHLQTIPPPVVDLRPDFDMEFSNLIDEMLMVEVDTRPKCAYVLETIESIFKFHE